jgi:hypothetical protein
MTPLNSVNAVGLINKKHHRLMLSSNNFVDLLIHPESGDLSDILDGQHVQVLGEILEHPTKLDSCIVIVRSIDSFPGDASICSHGRITLRDIMWHHPVSLNSASKITGALGNGDLVTIKMPLINSRWERVIKKTFGNTGSVDIEIELTGSSRLNCRQILNNRSHEDEPLLMLTPSDSFVNQPLHQARKTKSRKGIGPKLRRDVMQRDNYTCKECGASPAISKGVFLEIDHIIPVSKGGGNEITNLQTLCDACNAGKGNQLPGNTSTDCESDDPWSGGRESQAC